MILNKNIAYLIKIKGLTQTFVAKKIGISNSLLNHIIKKKSNPSYDTLQKMASFFDIDVDVLLNVDIESAGTAFKNDLSAVEVENAKMKKEIELLEKEIELLKKQYALAEKEMELTLREAQIKYERTKE